MQKIRRINAEQKKSHMLVLNNNTHSTALKKLHMTKEESRNIMTKKKLN